MNAVGLTQGGYALEFGQLHAAEAPAPEAPAPTPAPEPPPEEAPTR